MVLVRTGVKRELQDSIRAAKAAAAPPPGGGPPPLPVAKSRSMAGLMALSEANLRQLCTQEGLSRPGLEPPRAQVPLLPRHSSARPSCRPCDHQHLQTGAPPGVPAVRVPCQGRFEVSIVPPSAHLRPGAPPGSGSTSKHPAPCRLAGCAGTLPPPLLLVVVYFCRTYIKAVRGEGG